MPVWIFNFSATALAALSVLLTSRRQWLLNVFSIVVVLAVASLAVVILADQVGDYRAAPRPHTPLPAMSPAGLPLSPPSSWPQPVPQPSGHAGGPSGGAASPAVENPYAGSSAGAP